MNTNMKFITLPELKTRLGMNPETDKFDFVENPKTNKLFAAYQELRIKTEQSLTQALPIRFMYEPDKFDDGCIVNVDESKLSKPKFSI